VFLRHPWLAGPWLVVSPGIGVRPLSLLEIVVLHLVGFAWLTCHMALVASGGIIAYVPTMAVACAFYLVMPFAGFVLLLEAALYQNWVLSLVSGGDMGHLRFQALQGTTFALTVAFAGISVLRMLPLNRVPLNRVLEGRIRPILSAIAVGLGVSLVYTVAGALLSSGSSAAIYFRNTTSSLLLLVIAMEMGERFGYREVARALVVAVIPGMFLAVAEFYLPNEYYTMINAVDFSNMKYSQYVKRFRSFFSTQDIVDFRTDTLFNLRAEYANSTQFRIGGPSMHAISYSYVLSVAAVAAVTLREFWLALALLPLILLVGGKGAAILLLAATAIYLVQKLWRGRRAFMLAGTLFGIVFVVGGVWYGSEVGDYHVIGFLGGVSGFLENPLGHGIGVGGNLSELGRSQVDWSAFQKFGATLAVESAVGVLLYQMGIGCLALMAVYWRVLSGLLKLCYSPGVPGLAVFLPAALLAVLINGVFQEEAYAPSGLGFILVLAGAFIADSSRVPVEVASEARAEPPAADLALERG
jgi:hypothetical protein